LLPAPPPANISAATFNSVIYNINIYTMPNMPIQPAVPIIMPNSQEHEPFEWVSSEKQESSTWATDEDGLKMITVTRVTTDKFTSWTCTR